MNSTHEEGLETTSLVLPEWNQVNTDSTFSFCRCFTFEERSDAIWFITEVVRINKLHVTIEAIADDLSKVKILVRSDLCKLNLKTLMKVVTSIEGLYYERNAA